MTHRLWAGALVAAFFGLEFVFRTAWRDSRGESPARDRRTTSLLLVGFVLAIVALAVGPAWGPTWPDPWRSAGLVVGFVGLTWRAWAMKTLGAFYTETLRTVSEHRVVRTGPYRWIRHPGYLGSLVVWTGAAVASGAVLATVAILALLAPTYLYRILAEERMLGQELGDKYAQYAQRSWRLLPFVF